MLKKMLIKYTLLSLDYPNQKVNILENSFQNQDSADRTVNTSVSAL